MGNIIGFEKGKETEKAIKQALGLPANVSKTGKIDAVYNGVTIEIKRGNARLYAGTRFNQHWTALSATMALYSDSYENTGSAMTKSEKVVYSTDGTVEQTYVMSTELFLFSLAIDGATKLCKRKDGRMELRISTTKNFLSTIKELGTPLARWKEIQDTIAERLASG